jgi:hypothetical protein
VDKHKEDMGFTGENAEKVHTVGETNEAINCKDEKLQEKTA